jgi:RNA methyltransferase, TrmH family
MLSRMPGAVTRQRASVRRYRELARAPGGNGLERDLLLDGVHLLSDALASGLRVESAAFEHTILEDASNRSLAEKLAATGSEVMIVSRSVLETMSPVRTPSGAVGIAHHALTPVSTALGARPPALVVAAVGVQDPGNVGALIRSAEAAGATAFLACEGTADPFAWKALRGSMGSALRVPIATTTAKETMRGCDRLGVRTVALMPRSGKSFLDNDWKAPTALFLGNEGAGLPSDIVRAVHHQVSIPMDGSVESLNVAVAAALVLYEGFRQRHHEPVRRA